MFTAITTNIGKKITGISLLAERLAENHRINKVYFLSRHTSIKKLASGGPRSKAIHLQTIQTAHDIDITGEIVLLMDDVTTTGTSLYACKEILIENGAKEVEMFALGKAV